MSRQFTSTAWRSRPRCNLQKSHKQIVERLVKDQSRSPLFELVVWMFHWTFIARHWKSNKVRDRVNCELWNYLILGPTALFGSLFASSPSAWEQTSKLLFVLFVLSSYPCVAEKEANQQTLICPLHFSPRHIWVRCQSDNIRLSMPLKALFKKQAFFFHYMCSQMRGQ